jgi:radical SAM protein with 4Fe4S-binding SPASM domain
MPSVFVTAKCQNACAWCSARSKMEEYRSRGIEEMDWQDFTAAVEFCERSGVRKMALLGGEPTMHSRFIDMLRCLKARGFSTTVFTNAIIPDSLVDAIAREGFPDVRFVVNSTSYFDHGSDKRRTIDYVLRTIPNSVSLAYVVTPRDVLQKGLQPILDQLFLIMKFGLRPAVQLGIAVPSDGNRDFMPFGLYPAAVELLESWSQFLEKNGVTPSLVWMCIPPCCVPPGAQLPCSPSAVCTPPAFIGPNLDVWPCLPLSAETFRLEQFRTLAEARAFLSNLGSTERFYEPSCQACPERLSKACNGGCRGFQALRRASDGLAVDSMKRNPVRSQGAA